MLSTDRNRTSAISGIAYETVQQMSPQSFQEKLRSRHIVIIDNNISHISCDRRGLISLNSLKEVVNIEGIFICLATYIFRNLLIKCQDQSTSDIPQLKNGNLKQFVDNLELNNPNILRIIRMKSYSGAEFLPFASDHVAWRETAFNPYCAYDLQENSSLRWTDVSTKNAVQRWRIAPAGFGVFLDIRSGCQLIIIATTAIADESNLEGVKDCFTQWGRYVEDFDTLDPASFSENNFEAIRLEPGNRL